MHGSKPKPKCDQLQTLRQQVGRNRKGAEEAPEDRDRAGGRGAGGHEGAAVEKKPGTWDVAQITAVP